MNKGRAEKRDITAALILTSPPLARTVLAMRSHASVNFCIPRSLFNDDVIITYNGGATNLICYHIS
jgi:hypothetical protein